MTRLNVLISGGFTGAYQQLLPGFEQASGIKVMTGSGASQGTGPHAIAAQLARSVPADVVILSREASTNCSLLGVSLRERISTWRARRSAWRCGREHRNPT
jgi:ABC-type molybdate transport system substrate-binding protein